MEKTQEARDISDSLKIEVGSLPPKKDKALRELTATYVSSIESRYAQFIRPDILERVKNLPYNTFALPNPNEVANIWEGKAWMNFFDRIAEEIGDTVSVGRQLRLNGQSYLFVEDVDTTWGRFVPNLRKKLAKSFGTEEAAKRAVAGKRFELTLVHELAHAFQDQNLPTKFKEASAEFIMQEVTGIVLKPELNGFFAELVRKYGDDVYRVIFGSTRNPIARFRITRELSPQRYSQIMSEHSEMSAATQKAVEQTLGSLMSKRR